MTTKKILITGISVNTTEQGLRFLLGQFCSVEQIDIICEDSREEPVALVEMNLGDGQASYPRGLKGETIPFEARLFALIDVFHALTSVRVYKPALSLNEALAVMARERGYHFDPMLFGQFRKFAQRTLFQHPRDEAGVMEMLMQRFYPNLDRFALEN